MRVSSSVPFVAGSAPSNWMPLQNTASVGSLQLAGISAAPLERDGHLASKLRSGQILLPSGGASNDAARARNSGRRLCPKMSPQRMLSPKSLSSRMTKSASEPSFWGARSAIGPLPDVVQGMPCALASSASAPELKTPRTVRGMVRQTSVVQIQYHPGMQVARLGAGAAFQRAAPSGSKEYPSRPNTAGQASPQTGKRVTWADKVNDDLFRKTTPTFVTAIPKEGTPSPAKVKCQKLMDGLYKLRRVGGIDGSPRESPASPEGAEPQAQEAEEEEEQQLTLLNQTLSSVDDVEAQLRLTEAMLEGAHEPVAELGGARHATTLVSARTLAVVKRKADLCKQSEAHVAAFEVVDLKRLDLLEELVAGDAVVPDGYRGIKKILASLVHRSADGKKMNPVEADKAPFEVFAVSFGLAPEHHSLVRLKALAMEATEWWAEQTLQEAYKGADSFILQRLINVTIGFLDIGESGHEKLVQVKVVLGDRLAEKVLDIAQKLAAKDAQVVERSEIAQPENARKVADEIDAEIKEAVALGAPNKHPKLAEAKNIAVSFHYEEKCRWALKVLQFAQTKKEEDRRMLEKAGDKVPPVGPASEAGDAIERELQACIKKGAPEEHPRMQEAKQVMKWLRDQDGERKRMAAREKRLAEAAARKAEG